MAQNVYNIVENKLTYLPHLLDSLSSSSIFLSPRYTVGYNIASWFKISNYAPYFHGDGV